jgi:hypothetical protein
VQVGYEERRTAGCSRTSVVHWVSGVRDGSKSDTNDMKRTFALMVGVSSLLLAGCVTTHQVSKWEYKQATGLDTANALGQEGWEMVGFSYTPAGSTVFLLKREKH